MERHNNAKVEQILRDSVKGIDSIPPTPNGVCARLFRKFLMARNVNIPLWYSLLNEFVKNVTEGRMIGMRPNPVSLRGNTTKTLSKTEMTFNNLFDGLRFLGFKKVRIIIIGTDENDKEYTVEENIALNKPSASSLSDDEKEPEDEII